jgi:hypothetical protein
MIETKHSDLTWIRKELLEKQNYLCPITKTVLTEDIAVVDHHHKFFKDQIIGENKIGLIRGCLNRQVNVLEGKISNSYYRLGLHKLDNISLPDILRNLADYLENNITNYVHPSEIKKPKKLKFSKNCYNKLIKKMFQANKKLPDYPKNGVLTKSFEKLFIKYNVEIEYLKN